MAPNPLISTTKVESSLRAALHPLVLLTISDYITRHTLRKLQVPIVGVLIGQQNGREISIEHAYDVTLAPPPHPREPWTFLEEPFQERLQQYKDVHKEPALDLVGWWTVSPSRGPGAEILGIQRQIMQLNESAVLLTFHPEAVLKKTAVGGKLPLTIYESVYEQVTGTDAGGDEAMQVEGEEDVGSEKLEIRLKELGYEIATGEAEMISVDFVARGGGNAAAITGQVNPHAKRSDPIGKGKEMEVVPEQSNLNSEEEELMSFLTSRANAIKMLQSRLSDLKTYLNSLPPSYLNSSTPLDPAADIPHVVPRAILALIAKLPLVVPGDVAAFEEAQASERSDVELVRLLGGMGRSIQQARQLGTKFAIAEASKKAGMGLGDIRMGPELAMAGLMGSGGLGDFAMADNSQWTADMMQQ